LQITDDGLDGVGVEVLRQRGIVDPVRGLNRGAENFQVGIAERRQIITERTDAFGGGARLIFGEEFRRSGNSMVLVGSQES